MSARDERFRILQLVEQGQASAEEAMRLLDALEGDPAQPASGTSAASAGRWLHVRVADAHNGRNKVNVTIPTSLVDVGLKMGARFAPEMEGFDLTRIAELIKSGAAGQVLEVHDSENDELVQIYVE